MGKLWDNLQQGLSCCGSTGSQDWMESRFRSEVPVMEIGIQGRSEKMSQNLSNLPPSCCRYLGTNSLQKCNNNTDSLFTEGCSKKITDIISSNATLFISMLSGFLILEILLSLSFWTLACCGKRKKTNNL